MKWEMVRLGDIVKMVTGKTPPTSNIDYFDGGYLWVNPSDFGSKHIVETKRTISQKAVDEKKCTLLPKEAVLLSCIGDIGKIGILKTEGASNQQITGLIAKENVYSDYLYYYLMYSKAKLESLANKAVVAILNNERLRELEVILPPLAIQKRIAEVLDAADALRRKDQQLLQKYDELAQAVFVDMFGDLSAEENTKCVLSDISDITNGVTKNEKLEYAEMIEAPYLRVANVQDGHLDLSEIKSIKVKASDYQKYQLKKLDILLTEGGDPDKLGRGTTWNEEIPNCIFQNHLFRIRVQNDSIRPFFLAKLIGSKYGKKYFLKAAKQTTGIATINSSQLKAFPVIVPPVEKQLKYEDLCLQVEKAKMKTKLGLDYSSSMFQTLLHQAFNGELITP